MNGRGRQRHRGLITNLVADVEAGAESPLEVTYLNEVEQAHGLPIGRRQEPRSGLPYATDVGYDAFGLLVELDCRAWHEGARAFRDMNRDNLFVPSGAWGG